MLDAAFLSHAILWFIGGMAVLGAVSSLGAMFYLGRATNRKD